MFKDDELVAQGDLVLNKADECDISKMTPIPLKNNRMVILEGEAHNHAHIVADPTAASLYEDMSFNSKGNRRFLLHVVKPTQLQQINTATNIGYISPEEYVQMKASNDPRLETINNDSADSYDLHAPIDLLPGKYEITTQRTIHHTGKNPGVEEDFESLIRPVID